jgi:ACS family sodium-dependent inorganic phosphate cotransporter
LHSCGLGQVGSSFRKDTTSNAGLLRQLRWDSSGNASLCLSCRESRLAQYFYFFGTLALIWCAIWWVVVAESPDEDPKISKAELNYIKESLGHIDPNRRIHHPWKEILKSLPVWAIVVSHFSENWGFYTLLTQLPKFMKEILNFDLGRTGFMSALPYLAMSIVIPISGYVADRLQEKGILTTTQVRKLFNCGAFLAQTVFMLGAAFVLTPGGTITCLTLAVGLGGFAWSGFR